MAKAHNLSSREYYSRNQQRCYKLTSSWRKRERIKTGKSYLGPKRQKLADWIVACKSYPCFDCGGEFPPECMDFDHVRGTKIRGISEMVSRCMDIEVIRVEMTKCELICANCHRIRSKKRFYENDEKPKGTDVSTLL